MPILDGFKLIESIRNNEVHKDMPVIALSGRTDIEKAVYTRAGFNNKLLKPYKPEELKQNIAQLLNLEFEKKEDSVEIDNERLRSDTYDLTDIYEFSGRDEDAMQTIIQAFLEGAHKSLKELKLAYQEGDEDKLGKLAHRMLPMLRQMKANEVVVILMKLESREKVSQPEFDHFEVKINRLMASLDPNITV